MSLEIDGLVETLRAVQGLSRDVERPQANAELRSAAMECATSLMGDLQAAASASGVPVAPRVASAMRVKSDRMPLVQIGGAAKVGVRGGTAGQLVWGSEQGPKGEVNHFGVPPSSGYWIAPTVKRFESSAALPIYLAAVTEILRKWRLL